MEFDEFEKIIITDIIEQYPEYKPQLQSQFKKIPCKKESCLDMVFQHIIP